MTQPYSGKTQIEFILYYVCVENFAMRRRRQPMVTTETDQGQRQTDRRKNIYQ